MSFDPSKFPRLQVRKTLLIVDVQNDFLSSDGQLPVVNCDYLTLKIAMLVSRFRTMGDVIWVRSEFKATRSYNQNQIITGSGSGSGSGSDSRSAAIDPEAFLSYNFGQKPFSAPGSEGAKVPLALQSIYDEQADTTIIKSHYSSFKDTNLVRRLRQNIATELYLCGSLANVGVLATAIDATPHGNQVTVIRDCCGWRDEGRRDRAFAKMEDVYACRLIESRQLLRDSRGMSRNSPRVVTSTPTRQRVHKPKKHASSPSAADVPKSDEKSKHDSALEPTRGQTPDLTDAVNNLSIKSPKAATHRVKLKDVGIIEPDPSLEQKTDKTTDANNDDPPKSTPSEEASKASFASAPTPTPTPATPEKESAKQQYAQLTGPEFNGGIVIEVDEDGSDDMELAAGWHNAPYIRRVGLGAMRSTLSSISRTHRFPSERIHNSFVQPSIEPDDQPSGDEKDKTPAEDTAKTPIEKSAKTPAEKPTKIPAENTAKTPTKNTAKTLTENQPKSPKQNSQDPATAEASLLTPLPKVETSSSLTDTADQAPRKAPTTPKEDTKPPQPPQPPRLCEGDTTVIEDVLEKDFADEAFNKLLEEVQWEAMSHRSGQVPRRVAVQGAVEEDGSKPLYRHPADESPPLKPFSPTVLKIKQAVEEHLGHRVNHVLIQHYRTGHDYISEHSDKTLDIARTSYIANVSLGAQRTMIFRTKRADKVNATKCAAAPEPTAGGIPRLTERVALAHNSLLRMGLYTNKRWLHGIKQDRRADRDKDEECLAFGGARISLTFRHIATFISGDDSKIWGQGAVAKTKKTARNVALGDGVATNKVIAAFGRENHDPLFDWDEAYGEGCDVLHMKLDDADDKPEPGKTEKSDREEAGVSGASEEAVGASQEKSKRETDEENKVENGQAQTTCKDTAVAAGESAETPSSPRATAAQDSAPKERTDSVESCAAAESEELHDGNDDATPPEEEEGIAPKEQDKERDTGEGSEKDRNAEPEDAHGDEVQDIAQNVPAGEKQDGENEDQGKTGDDSTSPGPMASKDTATDSKTEEVPAPAPAPAQDTPEESRAEDAIQEEAGKSETTEKIEQEEAKIGQEGEKKEEDGHLQKTKTPEAPSC